MGEGQVRGTANQRGMATFIDYEPNQPLLLPPDMREWLPEGHLALFVSDVVDTLDLSGIYRAYEGEDRGRPAYHPAMMVKLLIYGYSIGVTASRKIEDATWLDVAFRVLAANQHPDHDTIVAFRKRHLGEFRKLFSRVLRLCQASGLVKLGQVALDGTKVKANASKHKAMSYGRMLKTEKKLREEIEELLRRAERADTSEDALFGKGKRGDELPEELRRRQSRLKKIMEAKALLEAEARAQAAGQERGSEEEKPKQGPGPGPAGGGPAPREPEEAVPKSEAQTNFTDPDSRIMWDSSAKSFEQAYNAQAVVDGDCQVIVAAAVTQKANDKEQLVPMLKLAQWNLGRMPAIILADAGYFSARAVGDELFSHTEVYVPPDKHRHGEAPPPLAGPPPEGASPAERMRYRLRTEPGRQAYARRKAIVEPVFGQIKEARGFRRFSLRGFAQVSAEWQLVCLAHNLRKLFRYGSRPALAEA